MCEAVLGESIIGRARMAGLIRLYCHQIRDYTLDKHHRVDDSPYGGGKGMVMQAEPIYRCYQAVCAELDEKPYVIYMSPKGNVFSQKKAAELSEKKNIFVICGHYEGVDQRVIDCWEMEEVSIGDYILTGGELPAMVLVDSVARLIPGVLSGEDSAMEESVYSGLLEYPQYTQPREYEDIPVPEILLSGHHKNIDLWRFEKSLELTRKVRPDMFENYCRERTQELDKAEKKILQKVTDEK